MSQSVQAIKRFLETHDRFATHNRVVVEDADYEYGKVSLAFEDHVKNSLDMLHGGALFTLDTRTRCVTDVKRIRTCKNGTVMV